MNEVKHTLGPWWSEGEYDEDEGGCAIIAANTDCGPLPGNPTRGMVAWASELLPEHADECIANARLIAAAPEMLEALYEAEEYFDNRADADHDETGFVPNKEMTLLVSIRAAIAKATGSTK